MSERKKRRIDRILVEKGMVESRERAKALLMAGMVMVDGVPVDKAGKEVRVDSTILLKERLRYVGRGGLKLEGALESFKIEVSDLVALDVGSSTGGFTDCLLKGGAGKVYAVDVGVGLLDTRLRGDPRVVPIEGENIRHIESTRVDEAVDLAVVDVSFISLEKVIPKVSTLVKRGGRILALIKPQFEVGRGEVGKGGIVRSPEEHGRVVEKIRRFAEVLGMLVLGTCESPIKGAKGNVEFWIYLKNPV